jgi:hypothetical protein
MKSRIIPAHSFISVGNDCASQYSLYMQLLNCMHTVQVSIYYVTIHSMLS